jgi:hypothetical protein
MELQNYDFTKGWVVMSLEGFDLKKQKTNSVALSPQANYAV